MICPPKTRPSPVLESGRGQDTKEEGTSGSPCQVLKGRFLTLASGTQVFDLSVDFLESGQQLVSHAPQIATQQPATV